MATGVDTSLASARQLLERVKGSVATIKELPTEEENRLGRLHHEARSLLHKLEERVTDLEDRIEEEATGLERAKLDSVFEALRQLKLEKVSSASELRAVVMQYRAACEKQRTQARVELLGLQYRNSNVKTNDVENLKNKMKGNQGRGARAAQDVTAGLRRTRQMMAQEIERVTNVTKVLDEGSSTLSSTVEEYQGLSGAVEQAKGLLTSLQRRSVRDKIVLCIGLAFFISVVSYIVYKRVRRVFGFIYWPVQTLGDALASSPPETFENFGETWSQNAVTQEDPGYDHDLWDEL